jgi:iduronate 2-sulfatase
MDDQLVREARHGYYAAVTWLDEQVGRLLRRLAHHGMSEGTLVVMHGDHGYHLGEHGMWRKVRLHLSSAFT